MRAIDVNRHLNGLIPDLKLPGKTVDRVIYGDPEREVSGIAVAWMPYRATIRRAWAWVAGEWCQDTGRPLIVVNHCVAEEPGMVTLAAHLREAFPDVPVTHIPQKCTYRHISG